MKKLVGGFDTLKTSYRVYYNEETMKLYDIYGNEIYSLSLDTLLNKIEEFNLEKIESKYLIRQEKNNWFCECVVSFKGSIEVFIIAYGETPEEAFRKCGGLIKD